MSNFPGEFRDTVITSETSIVDHPNEDVLRRIDENSPSEVRSTLERLESHGQDSTILYQLLLLASKGIQNRKHFYVPRKDSGSPLVLMKSKDKEEKGLITRVSFFTSIECLDELLELFVKTNVLNFNEGILFGGIHDVLADTIKQVCEARGGVFKCTYECTLMTLSPQLALQLDVQVPEHVFLAPLNKNDANTVHNNWPPRVIKKPEVTEREISNLPSMGLYFRGTDEIVSWILVHDLCSMGMMYTKKVHRSSGYGGLVGRALSKHLATIGLTPFVMVNECNPVSFNCFRKMGFKPIHTVKWLTYAPPHLVETVEFFSETSQLPQDECDLEK